MIKQIIDTIDEALLDNDRIKDYNNLIYDHLLNIIDKKDEVGTFYSLCYAIDRSIKENRKKLQQADEMLCNIRQKIDIKEI